MTTLAEIELATKAYTDARETLFQRIEELEEAARKIRNRRMPGIRSAVAEVQARAQALETLVDSNRTLFAKPRTRIFHGIKVGVVKAKGKITWQNGEAVCRLIRKHHADQADTLIKVTEAPVKAALGNLSAAELKKLGVETKDAGDEVVVKPQDSAIDKMVDALLKTDDDDADDDEAEGA